ncbi:MAG: DoxX family protein [Chitinophagales bacterium]|nr:DoxX family protein [Chitinophagaceae bacterium]MCB9066080.1 DoxX family protein [Chitinophagales bacterium]
MALLSGLGKYKDFGLLVMRAGVGIMMVLHGYPKLIGGPEKWEKIGKVMVDAGIDFYPVFWGFMASFAEGIGGALLVLGLMFRWTSLLLFITMFFAAFKHLNAGDGIMGASHAIELAVVFLGLLFLGPGKYSIDKK